MDVETPKGTKNDDNDDDNETDDDDKSPKPEDIDIDNIESGNLDANISGRGNESTLGTISETQEDDVDLESAEKKAKKLQKRKDRAQSVAKKGKKSQTKKAPLIKDGRFSVAYDDGVRTITWGEIWDNDCMNLVCKQWSIILHLIV